MKKIFYIFLAVSGLVALDSCGRFEGEYGNPLVNYTPADGELTGDRALFREYTDVENIAEYRYTGLLVTEVIGPMHKRRDNTKIIYSGTKIATVIFNGRKGTDSIEYSQNFTHGINDRIDKVTETRKIWDLSTDPPLNNLPAPTVYKTQYDMKFNTLGSSRFDEITMKTRIDVVGNTDFTDYSKTIFTYTGNNVTKVVKEYGAITGGNVFEPATSSYVFEYTDYDDKIAPTTLLPYGYNLSRILANDSFLQSPLTPGQPVTVNIFHYIMSANNPEKLKVSELNSTPINMGTDYVYDKQNFMTKGFNVYYLYKPM